MKKQLKSLLLVTLLATSILPMWGQATPSTEGRDFWVTFLQRNQDAKSGDARNLKLTISTIKACDVTIENTTTGFYQKVHVNANSSRELIISDPNNNNEPSCYSATNETVLNTALHVTSTEDISLFAGNYLYKSFDAANILPTPALLDDYLIQTYPPSDHEDKSQGSHFAIVAVEDNTIVDYNLTAKTAGGKTGTQTTPTLRKGQVWYVWTGRGSGDVADLSGTTVKARNGKKIAVFQGCVHTNIPTKVRDRDHIYSQAMPTAYWGSEFGITASRKHRRDIVAVMAINDGTEVYINNEDGDPILVHTFNFNSSDPQERKHYWTFEIGEELAYCADDNKSEYSGQLPPPLVIDSSCYLTSSCPVGVHLFMVSNRYDNVVPKVDDDTLVSDPAMLWVSPIEQVIKEINFATYHTQQATFHFMNILTTTADVPNIEWNGNNIASHFHPISGNSDYSFARLQIPEGQHHLKGNVGFLAHVYGYGERESYAYSCGSSTIQRSVTFNGSPLMIDSVYSGVFCVGQEIDMKLNIGNNDYESIEWDFGDGITYAASPSATNDEKKQTSHTYTSPGWYDLTIAAVYVNHCTNQRFNEDMHFSFRVVRQDTVTGGFKHECISVDGKLPDGTQLTEEQIADLLANGGNDTTFADCPNDVVIKIVDYGRDSKYEYSRTEKDSVYMFGKWYYASQTVEGTIENASGCDSLITCHLTVITSLDMSVVQNDYHICPGEELDLAYKKTKGDIQNPVLFIVPGVLDAQEVNFSNDNTLDGTPQTQALPTTTLSPGKYHGELRIVDKNAQDTLDRWFDFTVYYPDSVFKYKYNNVLAVYKPGRGGNEGWTFTAYQWYRNGDAIPGATQSVYHVDSTFVEGDEYYVELTDDKGVTIPSCKQTIDEVPVFDASSPAAAPARKILVNRRMVIYKDDKMYDIYGQRVQ